MYNQAMTLEGDVDYLHVKSYPSKKLKRFMPKIDDKTWKVAGTLRKNEGCEAKVE